MYAAKLMTLYIYCAIIVLQVSYTPAGETEGTTVRNHFQLYPAERNLALALVAVVKEYGWRQLSILTQNEQPFIKVSVFNHSKWIL